MSEDLIKNMKIELKRGTLTLIILYMLHHKEYGYSLLQKLKENNINIDANTLYPLLRRLETQGLLDKEWDTDSSRPRKYYVISDVGKGIFVALQKEWFETVSEINKVFDKE